jgi:hypothetical protein
MPVWFTCRIVLLDINDVNLNVDHGFMIYVEVFLRPA